MHSSTVPCHLCSKEAALKFQGHMGYQNTQKYDIYHCENCYTAFALPLTIDENIYNHIYSQIEKVPGYERYYRYANEVLLQKDPLEYLSQSEDVYWSIQDYFNKRKDKRIKVLEVGCGFGYLTYALQKSGYDVLGLDISHVAVSQSKERYGDFYLCADIKEYADQVGPVYDVIIFTEVIEHIPDVKGFLEAANKLLLPQGDLIMTTPNRSFFPSDVLWESDLPPVHFCWFSEKSLTVLSTQLNHNVRFIDFTPFTIQEYKKHKTYPQPYIEFRNFQPTRLPVFDEKFNLIKRSTRINVTIPSEPLPEKPVRKKIKKALHAMGLLKMITNLKEKYRILQKIRFLRKSKPVRPTLCAIFHKQ